MTPECPADPAGVADQRPLQGPPPAFDLDVLERLPLSFAAFGDDFRCRFANEACREAFGLAAEAMAGTHLLELLDGRAAVDPDRIERALLRGEAVAVELALSGWESSSDRTSGWLLPYRATDGRGHAHVVLLLGTAGRTRIGAEEPVGHGRLLAALLDTTADGIFAIDAGGIIRSVNRAGAAMFGYAASELAGMSLAMLVPLAQTGWPPAAGQGCEIKARRKDGSILPIHLSFGDVGSGDGVRFVGIARNLSERYEAEARERYLSTHDALTGLLTRQAFLEDGERLFLSGTGESRVWMVLNLDVDQFRDVNEGFGYHIGDAALRAVVERVTAVLPPDSLFCRVAADEFAALVTVRNREHAEELVRAVQVRIQDPVPVDRHTLILRTSIGAAVVEGGGQHIEDVLNKSELALQQAQGLGGNTVCFYTPEMAAAAGRRMLLTMHLANAVQRGELTVVYQPIVESSSKRITQVEALLRWIHPTLGPISPAEFIPVAEDSGLIIPVTEWLLETVVEQLEAWHAEGFTHGVCVNISGLLLTRENLVPWFAGLLRRAPHLKGRIGIEITEQAAIRDIGAAIQATGELAAIGVEAAIDDFGTGYSSLGYLQQLPLRKLKIDRVFVDGLPGNEKNGALVRAIIGMAHGLGLTVIAEGVETLEQQDFLVRMGCDRMQGYLFGRPVSAAELEVLLRSSRTAHSPQAVDGLAQSFSPALPG